MLTSQHNPPPDSTEEPFRYSRSETVRILHDSSDAAQPLQSTRAFARAAGVPHTTLHYWQQRQQRTDAPAPLVAFFDSPDGLAFLKRLLLALHLVFQQAGIAGLRPLCRFLVLAHLDAFVAASYGTHQQLATWLQQQLDHYDQQQRQQLALTMTPKTVTLCEDENFHGAQPCLVAIEPLSNFLVLEAYQPQRDAQTWNTAVQTALAGLPVTVVQVTSDLASGLRAHACDGLQAHHSPDLLHVQADLHKATSLPLQRLCDAATAMHLEKQATAQEWQQRYQQHQAGIRTPGPAPDFEDKIGWANTVVTYWEQQLSQQQQRQEQVREAVRALGDDYHPFDNQTGQAVCAQQLQQRLEQRVATVERVAQEADLSEACRQKIAKAKRVLPRLVATLVWFWHSMQLLVESLELTQEQERVVNERLLPGLYWAGAAERGRTAADKARLRGLSVRLLQGVWSESGVWNGVAEAQQKVIKGVCQEGVNRFVRSSSCVEGRNGQLSLYHHGSHALSPGKLKALTVLHNYFIERSDGSTAAERFFGQKPADLFDWLLQRFPDPPRPAKRARQPVKLAG